VEVISSKDERLSLYSFILSFYGKMMIAQLFLAICFVASVWGKVYFQEDFNDKDWKSRWVVPSDWKSKVRSCIFFLLLNPEEMVATRLFPNANFSRFLLFPSHPLAKIIFL